LEAVLSFAFAFGLLVVSVLLELWRVRLKVAE
jgi:hypothetical protein